MIDTTHYAKPSLLRRIIAFPLTLLVLEFAAVVVFASALSEAAKAAGIMDKGPADTLGSVVLVVLTIGLWKFLQNKLERRTDREFAFPGAARELAAGLAIGFALFSVATALVALLGGFEVLGLRGTGALWSMLSLAVVSGVFEEIMMRGILLRHLETMLGSWAALGLSAAIFGALHLPNPGATLFAAVAIAMEAGILLGAAYLLTRRLWLAIGIHAAWNFTQGWVFSVPVSGGDAPLGLLITRRVGPDWLTGGGFGLEASVVALVVASAAGLAMLAFAARRGQIQPAPWRKSIAASQTNE